MDAIVASKLFIIAATLTFFYIIDGAIYRLYLSPIARFPGPKIAALTGWYEFYYDIPKKGSYLYEIEKMHRKYGRYLQERHIASQVKYLLIDLQVQ